MENDSNLILFHFIFGGLIVAIFECAVALPTSNGARNEISGSLFDIGTSQPSVFFSAAHAFLIQQNKLSGHNRAFILSIINKILESSHVSENLDEQQALLIINLVTQEITISKDQEEAWPQAASDVLVTLAKRKTLVNHVMDAVLQKFPPGLSVPPHRYIVLSMASIAEHNAIGFVPFLTDILSRSIPLLQNIKTDSHRYAWAHAFRSFCESLREYTTTFIIDKSQAINGRNLKVSKYGSEFAPSDYTDQMEMVYDSVFCWLSSKDPKVRAETANCVGELCLVITQKRLNEEIRKLIPMLLSLCRRATIDQHLITQGICVLLEAACVDDSCSLEPYLEDILNTLFPHVCVFNEEAINSNFTMRNQNEAFRCFHVAASRFADKIVYYLLHKMQSNQDPCKLGAINLMRHLLNSAGPYMEDKRALVILGLKPILQAGISDSLSIKVKKALCQLCIALADHGYIDAQGGCAVIEFLVKNAVAVEEISKKVLSDNSLGLSLRTQCGQALQTIANTCSFAHKLLWPYLFVYICVEAYTPVITDIIKCLRLLAERMVDEGEKLDFVTGFDEANVANNLQVFCRLLVCLTNAPLNSSLTKRAYEALRLLRAAASWFHSSLESVVEEYYDKLKFAIDGLSTVGEEAVPSSQLSPKLRSRFIVEWHTQVLNFLDACVVSVSEGEWRCCLASTMAKHFNLYINFHDEKAFLMRCIGQVLARITNAAFVNAHLMLMFRETNHSYLVERVGCAQAVGYCSVTHIDLVIAELERAIKWDYMKKRAKVFGFIQDMIPYKNYSDSEMANLHATIMLCYGFVVFHCPIEVVVQQVENKVLQSLRRHLENPQLETVERESLLQTIYLIAVSVHPSYLNADYHLEILSEFLTHIKNFVEIEHSEMLSSSVRLLSGKAIKSLLNLQPILMDKEWARIIRTSDEEISIRNTIFWPCIQSLTNSVFPLCRERSGLKTEAIVYGSLMYKVMRKTCEDEGSVDRNVPATIPVSNDLNYAFIFSVDSDERSTVVEATVRQFHEVLELVIRKYPVMDTVNNLLGLFQPYYSSIADHERMRSIEATLLVLNIYFDAATDFSLERANEFTAMASLLAFLVPRITDSLCYVRYNALKVVHWTFRLSFVLKGVARETPDPSLFDYDTFMQENLGHEEKLDNLISRKIIKFMANIVEARLPSSLVNNYMLYLFNMLNDRQNQVGSAAALLLSNIIKSRGDTLRNEAKMLMDVMLTKLSEVHSSAQVHDELQNAFLELANHQLHPCIDVMLSHPLPYSINVVEAWHTLVSESLLFPLITEYLIELMVSVCEPSSNSDIAYDFVDIGSGTSTKIVRAGVCSLAAGIIELVKNGQPENEFSKRIPQIIATLLIYLATVIDTQYPLVQQEQKDGSKSPLIITPELRRVSSSPATLVSQALLTLFARTRDEKIVAKMNSERAWTDCIDPVNYTTAIVVLIRSVNEHRPSWITPIINNLLPRIDSTNIACRIAATTVFSSLVKMHTNEDLSASSILPVVIDALKKGLGDKNLTVRKFAIRGFGDLSECSPNVLEKYSSCAMKAIINGLDYSGDRRDEVATEAVKALNKLSSCVETNRLQGILSNVLLKLRPCFEKENTALRIASFSLFGELGIRVGDCDIFKEQLIINSVSLLLHLNDDEDDVKLICVRCLMLVGPLFHSTGISSVIEKTLNAEKICANYPLFLKEFSQVLASSFPDRVNYFALNLNNYFKSTSSKIRSNAACMTGFLLGCLSPELQTTISKELIFSGLMSLLKDQSIDVRLSTARAISFLQNFA